MTRPSFRPEPDNQLAVSEIKTALAIDPKSCANQIIYGRILYFARRYDEAIVQFKRVIEVFPSWTTAYGWIWLTYEIKGDLANSFEWFIRNQEQNNVGEERISDYVNAHAEYGWRGIGEKLLEFERPDGPGGNFYARARHAIRTGKLDVALDYVERSFDAHQYQITWLAVDPYFDPIRSHGSFRALIDKSWARIAWYRFTSRINTDERKDKTLPMPTERLI